MIDWEVDGDLLSLAESGRAMLGSDFFNARDAAESALERGQSISDVVARGASTEIRLVNAAIAELRDLLCTESDRYKNVRERGTSFANAAVPAIAGYLAGLLGVSVALATAGVAFVALTVLKFGAGIFCSLTSVPPGGAPQ